MKFARCGFYRVLLVLVLSILSACGGGGDDGDNAELPTYSLWIVSPSNTGSYQTQATSVALDGGSFVPAGAVCTAIHSDVPPGYQVTVQNAANGASAYTTFYLGCLLQVNVIWTTAPVPLALGSNTITVTATDNAGHAASDSINVTRLP